MSEVLGASAGLPLWLDVTVGILLAVVLTITAELLARYAAKPARRSLADCGRSRAARMGGRGGYARRRSGV